MVKQATTTVDSKPNSPSGHILGADGRICAEESSLAITSWSNWLVAIDTVYAQYFSTVTENNEAYCQFLSLPGTLIKEEQRTTITLLSRLAENGNGPPCSFMLKVYRYPHISTLHTAMQMAKAEREYRGLRQCQVLGIPVAQPVGFGVERGLARTVRSCFVITRFIEDSVDFRAWLKQRDEWKFGRCEQTVHILRQLGQHLHRLHEERFFLTNPTPRNILIRNAETACLEAMFIDPVRARFLPSGLLARYGQRMDLGALIGPLLRHTSEDILEFFLDTYLPDPIGRTPVGLRRFILKAARVHNNRTVLAWASHRIHRAIRRRMRTLRGEKYQNEKGERSLHG
jgi:hypothetical protein